MIKIAGKPISSGDVLWHYGLRVWATVRADATSVTVAGPSGQTATYPVQDGGLIAGRRQLYWHQPLVLDLPYRDVTKYQTMIEAVKTVLGD